MSSKHEVLCQIVKADSLEVEISSGSMTRLAGVSKGLVGAEGIHLAVANIPPGCASSPHHHVNCESAIYVSKGKGRFLTGPKLEHTLEIQAGDFLYVPQNSVHQPINDSLSEDMELIVARNTPVEIVEEYKPES
ncbi:MAG: cupin domain-containing protein [Dehalococcoidia bacterium]